MLVFAVFTLGYFAGVFTVLLIFPPNVNELEEQEKDALQPIINLQNKKNKETTVDFPAIITSN